MLINLSNHPSSRWSEQQRAIAQKNYGSIIDIAFPQIPPEASVEEVRMTVAQYYFEIKDMDADEPITVHLMGEMTFTHMLINELKAAGFPCVASTTHRTVEERDGKKIVQFNFVQFRAYL